MTKDELTVIRAEAEKHQSNLIHLESLASAARSTSARASMLTRSNVSGQLKIELRQIDEDASYLFKQLQAMVDEVKPTSQYWGYQHQFALAEFNENAPARLQAMADEWRKNQ